MSEKDLELKNDFVISLKDYLMSEYGFVNQYTSEGSNFENKKASCLFKRENEKSEDITGFCFRKDLCSKIPGDEEELLEKIHNFSVRNGRVSRQDPEYDEILKITIGKTDYRISPYIEKGEAGHIKIHLNNAEDFS